MNSESQDDNVPQYTIQSIITSWLIYFTLRAHDFWIWCCNLAHELYCQILCASANLHSTYHKRRLLYAYLDPTETVPIPVDITPVVSAYYATDSILSCYTLQEWLKRFNIHTQYVNLVFIRDIRILISRLDLEEDTETITNSPADTNLSDIPALVIYITGLKMHIE